MIVSPELQLLEIIENTLGDTILDFLALYFAFLEVKCTVSFQYVSMMVQLPDVLWSHSLILLAPPWLYSASRIQALHVEGHHDSTGQSLPEQVIII